jgi:DNA-binding MarR family transcriptional regulator
MTVSVAPHTRRENVLALTEAGTALVRRGDALMETSRAAMLGAIDPRDLPAALRLLGRVVESLA